MRRRRNRCAPQFRTADVPDVEIRSFFNATVGFEILYRSSHPGAPYCTQSWACILESWSHSIVEPSWVVLRAFNQQPCRRPIGHAWRPLDHALFRTSLGCRLPEVLFGRTHAVSSIGLWQMDPPMHMACKGCCFKVFHAVFVWESMFRPQSCQKKQ